MVESPSLGMVFFFVLLAWAGLDWTERDGTDACMHACTHNMTDSMFRMGIDGCVPENFMENEQNMALALFFLLFKDTHTHTHTHPPSGGVVVVVLGSSLFPLFWIGKWDVSSRVRAWS